MIEINVSLISVSLIALSINAIIQLAQANDDNPFPSIGNVIDKLETVSSGQKAASELSLADLKAAKHEWDSWPEEKRQEARQVPMVRLVVDFAIHPMGFVHTQMDLNKPDLFKAFVKRLELCYKKFLPAYEGEQIAGGKVAIRVAKTLKLYETLKRRQPVTLSLFKDAKRECESWRSRMEEITNLEDIYANLDELTYLFNFFNLMTLKPLWMSVFPKMNELKDRENLNGEQLSKMYHQALEKYFNIHIDDKGNMIRYVDG